MNKKRITIEKIIAGGDGLGFIDGKAHFVPQTLPGEVVDVEVVLEKKSFNRCRVLGIIKSSEGRREPFCPIYDNCGGCNMQYADYESQIAIKKMMVEDIFARNGKIILPEFSFIESRSKGYRNRIQLHNSKNISGFKKNKSNDIIEISHCPLLVDNLNMFLKSQPVFRDSKVTLFSNGEITYRGDIDKTSSVKIKNRDIHFNPSSFFQSNISLVSKLIDRVNQFVTGESVMDLYCGVGLFSAFLPESVNKIIAVEIDERVEPFISKNLENRDYHFYPMSLEEYVKRGHHKNNKADTIIVDPPRKGLSESVISFLAKSGAKRIIYVSCDPTTMARDVSLLSKSKYKLDNFCCFDFYPNTNHIEAFGVLYLE